MYVPMTEMYMYRYYAQFIRLYKYTAPIHHISQKINCNNNIIDDI